MDVAAVAGAAFMVRGPRRNLPDEVNNPTLDQETDEDAPCPTAVTPGLFEATWGLTPAHAAALRDALDMLHALGPSVVVNAPRAFCYLQRHLATNKLPPMKLHKILICPYS